MVSFDKKFTLRLRLCHFLERKRDRTARRSLIVKINKKIIR